MRAPRPRSEDERGLPRASLPTTVPRVAAPVVAPRAYEIELARELRRLQSPPHATTLPTDACVTADDNRGRERRERHDARPLAMHGGGRGGRARGRERGCDEDEDEDEVEVDEEEETTD